MKKKLVVLLCVAVLAGALSACGNNSAPQANNNTSDATKVETTTDDAEVDSTVVEDTTVEETEDDSTVVEDVTSEETNDETSESVYVGNWHEKVAGRGSMNVTLDGDTTCFDVIWTSSASTANTWKFSARENEAGVIYYSNAIKSTIEYDEDGNGTETVITEEGQGSVEVLMDGTMVWTDDGEEYEFVRD